METEQKNNLIQRERSTVLSKVVIYGEAQEGKKHFDHRQEAEPMGSFLSQMRVESINFWWLRTDNQNVALEGIQVRYKKLNQDSYFESSISLGEKKKNEDKENETFYLDNGEYIREIHVTTASANKKIGCLDFITTYNGRSTKSYGVGISRLEDIQSEPVPPGETKSFNFLKNETPGYVVGFFGQYDDNHITQLGVYIASFHEINYYARRPYILLYKKFQTDKNIVNQIAKRIHAERDSDRFKDATLDKKDGNSSKILFYFMDSAINHPELFKAVLEYL